MGDYARVLRRRASVVVFTVLFALVIGITYTSTRTPLYAASAQVLLSRDSPAATLTGITDPNTKGDPERFVQTQQSVARSDSLAARVLSAARLRDRSPSAFLAASSVTAPGSADMLVFSVHDPSRSVAARLARAYASQFALYDRALDEAALTSALDRVQATIDQLTTPGEPQPAGTPGVLAGLRSKQRQLEALEPLETGKALPLAPAPAPVKVRPSPKRDAVVSIGAGLLVGIILAFVLEALDRRVDSLSAVARALGAPLLGRIPPPRGAGTPEHLSLVTGVFGTAVPSFGNQAEAFHIVRANLRAALESANLRRPGTTVMVTSATRDDGKSTTAANLAVALALAGTRVTLVDLDSCPSVPLLFGATPGPGIVDVAIGRASLDEALDTFEADGGEIELLSVGGRAGELERILATDALAGVVKELRTRFDLVLLNAPPLLTESGALQVAASADALVVALRIDRLRERVLQRLRTRLESSPALVLGFVATGATADGVAREPWDGTALFGDGKTFKTVLDSARTRADSAVRRVGRLSAHR